MCEIRSHTLEQAVRRFFKQNPIKNNFGVKDIAFMNGGRTIAGVAYRNTGKTYYRVEYISKLEKRQFMVIVDKKKITFDDAF